MANISLGGTFGPQGFSPSIGISGGGGSSRAKGPREKDYLRQIEYIPKQYEAYREAGIHPAFAMGGGAPAPAMVGGGVPDTGSSVSISTKRVRAEEAAFTKESEARTQLLNAQTDEIYDRMVEARNQKNNPTGSFLPTSIFDENHSSILGGGNLDIQPQIGRVPHKSYKSERGRLGSRNQKMFYPPGTPAEQDEKELGEWALITQLPRVIKYFQMNDIIPTLNDIKDILRRPYLLQREPHKQTRKHPRNYRR